MGAPRRPQLLPGRVADEKEGADVARDLMGVGGGKLGVCPCGLRRRRGAEKKNPHSHFHRDPDSNGSAHTDAVGDSDADPYGDSDVHGYAHLNAYRAEPDADHNHRRYASICDSHDAGRASYGHAHSDGDADGNTHGDRGHLRRWDRDVAGELR